MRVLSVETCRPITTCNLIYPLTTIPRNSITYSFILPHRTHKTLITNFFSSFSLYSTVSSDVLSSQGRTGFSTHASRRRKKGNDKKPLPLEVEGIVDDDEDDDEDEEGIFIPFEGMRKWAQNKPSGFGEGKEYDTSIEDKLAEEIEQSRRAQLANINKLKNNPLNTSPKKELKAPEVQPLGIRVRVSNLPKKKNIQRDLQLAFKGFSGIVSISPAVSGSKKTREPICKGFAFVYFKSDEVANRFIQIYSKENLTFGKIQKKVKFEMINPNESPDSSSEQENVSPSKIQKQRTREVTNPSKSSDTASQQENLAFSKKVVIYERTNPSGSLISASEQEKLTFSKQVLTYEMTNQCEPLDAHLELATEKSYISDLELKIPDIEENPDTDSEDSLDSWEVPFVDESTGSDYQSVSANWEEEVEESIRYLNISEDGKQRPTSVTNADSLSSEYLNLSELKDDEKQRPTSVTKTDSLSSKQKPKNQKVKKKKKIIIKGKTGKLPKLDVPGSSKRLKIKEKTLLADVLSRYGKEASLVSQKES